MNFTWRWLCGFNNFHTQTDHKQSWLKTYLDPGSSIYQNLMCFLRLRCESPSRFERQKALPASGEGWKNHIFIKSHPVPSVPSDTLTICSKCHQQFWSCLHPYPDHCQCFYQSVEVLQRKHPIIVAHCLSDIADSWTWTYSTETIVLATAITAFPG